MFDYPHDASPSDALFDAARSSLSGVLRLDYLSTGAGHRQSAAVFTHHRRDPASARSSAIADEGQEPADDVPEALAHDGLDAHVGDDAPSATAAAQDEHDASSMFRPRGGRLSSSEEYRLARAACDGDPGARDRLVESLLGLVVMLARRYPDQGVALEDRVEDGMLGLLAAIERFDPERGFRLSTYAKWWVRQSIELALMTQSRAVHVPAHVARALRRSARDRIDASESAQHGAATASSPNAHDSLSRLGRHLLLADAGSAASDAHDEVDRLVAPDDDAPEEHAQRHACRRRLECALEALNDNERVVVRSRYGLDDAEVRTLASIANELGISAERVRQIQSAVLPKLRAILLRQGVDQAALI